MNLMDRFLVRATIAGVQAVTPRMRRIRVVGDSLRGMRWQPGQHVRVRVDEMRLRSYTIWDFADGEYLELCVLDHPAAGPGARWSRRIRAGLPIAFTRPTGRLVPRESVQYHLFVGDETASVAFGAILRDLPGHAGVHGVIEIEEPCDRLPLHRGAELHWIRRGDRGGLVDALRTLDLPDHPGAAYIAGEARDCQAARRHLIADRAWPSRSVITKPFWTPGKRGLD
jgi:NADPH-dependent ferric siderophore reductase